MFPSYLLLVDPCDSILSSKFLKERNNLIILVFPAVVVFEMHSFYSFGLLLYTLKSTWKFNPMFVIIIWKHFNVTMQPQAMLEVGPSPLIFLSFSQADLCFLWNQSQFVCLLLLVLGNGFFTSMCKWVPIVSLTLMRSKNLFLNYNNTSCIFIISNLQSYFTAR